MLRFVIIILCLSFGSAAYAVPFPPTKPDQKIGKNTNIKPTDHHPNFLKATFDRPLNNKDKELYREVFALQNKGQFQAADRFIQKIDNRVLIGHVHAQKLLHNAYTPTELELAEWLKTYSDHPQSTIISRKTAKGSSTYKNRVRGTMESLQYFAKGSRYLSDKYSNREQGQIFLVRKEVKRWLDRGAATAALNYFNAHAVQKFIDPVDKSQILSDIAAVYLYLGYPDKAQKTALKALKASEDTPLPGWILGLTAWIKDDFESSTRYFTMASKAPYASPWMTAAASYWGARAATRAKLYPQVSALLATAVQHQRTFYGLIATKALGYGYDFNWTMPDYTPAMQNILQQYPAGARAIALTEIGRYASAEKELFTLPVKENSELATAALSLAHHHNLAGYTMRFSSIIPNTAGGYYDAGLFPLSSWTAHKKEDDISLLNAFIRQESRFNTSAKNPTGATGLMQIMPETAAFLTGDDGYKTDQGHQKLQNPRTNVDIGASYLQHLKSLDVVGGDLFGLAIAYNAGPGTLGRWKRDIKATDPLLFIEMIPTSETRAFVERVVTNYWVYQMRMGIDPKTLTAVASGSWPRLD
jgi:soluble lytic murein transglycosylase-like protein